MGCFSKIFKLGDKNIEQIQYQDKKKACDYIENDVRTNNSSINKPIFNCRR